MIVKSGNKYKVVSHSGRNMSKPMSRKEAKKRLREIEYFKRMRG